MTQPISKPFEAAFHPVQNQRNGDQAQCAQHDTASNRNHGKSLAPKE